MSTILEKITELRTLDERATKGPWTASQEEPYGAGIVTALEELSGHICVTSGNAVANARLIAEMRNTLNLILDSWQEQRDALKAAANVRTDTRHEVAAKARAALASANEQLP